MYFFLLPNTPGFGENQVYHLASLAAQSCLLIKTFWAPKSSKKGEEGFASRWPIRFQ